MTCDVVQTVYLRVGAKVKITLDLSLVCARKWRAGALFYVGHKIRVRRAGFEYEAQNDGQTGSQEPNWPRTLGGTVSDGSIVWAAVAISIDSLTKIIQSASWDAPAGLTAVSDTIDSTAQLATVYIQADSVGSYEVVLWATFDDTPNSIEDFAIKFEVSD